jgi:hypothetical protein
MTAAISFGNPQWNPWEKEIRNSQVCIESRAEIGNPSGIPATPLASAKVDFFG